MNSSVDEVEASLGVPTFANGNIVYGYVSNDNYLFFDFLNKQVSVYPVMNIDEADEEKLKSYIKDMNEKSDVKSFVVSLTNLWNDYDVYDYDSDYVDLRFTLKGFQLSISSASLKNGIYIYKNYLGNINISDLDNVYVTDTDFVVEAEKQRENDELLNRSIEGDISEEERKDFGIDFSVKFKSFDEKNSIGPVFYSRTQEYSDSELDRNLEVSSYKWYNESIIVYSVNNDGIYAYNCETRVNAKIIELEGYIAINSAGKGQIIYNDTQVLNVTID